MLAPASLGGGEVDLRVAVADLAGLAVGVAADTSRR